MSPAEPRAGRRPRRVLGVVWSAVAGLVLWAALVLPDAALDPPAADFVRLPLEGILLAALLALLPRRVGRVAAVLAGALLAVLTIAKVLNAASAASLGRPFDPVSDLGQLGSGAGVVGDALGIPTAVVVVGAVVVAATVAAALVAAAVTLASLVQRHRARAVTVSAGLAAVWVVLGLVGATLVPGTPLASAAASGFTATEVSDWLASASAARSFAASLDAPDPFAGRTAALAAGPLKGKDVLVVFVESYGQVAVQGTAFSSSVDSALGADAHRLAAAGFGSRTGTLVSPTFGGISWLAHSTLQSGVWVPNQGDYDRLLATRRLTLTGAFHEAGWRTVSDVPSDEGPWDVGRRFYDFDRMIDATDVGYAGPRFGYARIPDQYTLAHFAQAELGPRHAPVMAEIDLVSSHTPWTPLPRLVDPATLGNGSVYDPMPAEGLPADVAWRDPRVVQDLYARSIRYSIDALTDFILSAHDPDLVVLMLGDHQPAEVVSGRDADHAVPVSLIAAGPAVLGSVRSWGWAAGLQPAAHGTTWRMDRLRDRFLSAFTRGAVAGH